MTSLIISVIALIVALIALYRTFKPADKIELKIHDDLKGPEDMKANCRGVEIKNIKKVNKSEVGAFMTDEKGVVRRVDDLI